MKSIASKFPLKYQISTSVSKITFGILTSSFHQSILLHSLSLPCHSTLPQPSLTGPGAPHYLNHHSPRFLHTTST
ncbi:MAG: hypothetical protein L0922_04780, partial [Candidatus Mariimomonas ferrooxydans]